LKVWSLMLTSVKEIAVPADAGAAVAIIATMVPPMAANGHAAGIADRKRGEVHNDRPVVASRAVRGAESHIGRRAGPSDRADIGGVESSTLTHLSRGACLRLMASAAPYRAWITPRALPDCPKGLRT